LASDFGLLDFGLRTSHVSPSLPRIGITLGDPAGIGPEIAAKAIADPRVRAACEPVLYGPADLSPFPAGQLSAVAGLAAYDAIASATSDALAGRIAAIVTCPVNKEAFAMAGLPWRGHTDLLAHLTGAEFVAMMFYSPRLLVVLATVHVALREVPALVTRPLVERVVRLAARELPRFLGRPGRLQPPYPPQRPYPPQPACVLPSRASTRMRANTG
jgi:4-hydroxythreonine-4-phosphate dehydrogenase